MLFLIVQRYKFESKSQPEGEKLLHIGGGGFATKDGAKRLFEFYESINAKIKAECDPQEVYVYEYNNHECCIAWDGDLEAIRIVLSLFGEEAARKIKRFRASMTVDNLVRKPINRGCTSSTTAKRSSPRAFGSLTWRARCRIAASATACMAASFMLSLPPTVRLSATRLWLG